jgi:cysteine desulfurase
MKSPIYLDYHATTPTDGRVVDAVVRHMATVFGNPSSRDHVFGDEAEAAVARAAGEVAHLMGVEPREIVFTSGATEAANLALKGLALQTGRPLRIGLTPVEHPSVLDTCQYLADQGLAQLTYFRVDGRAQIDLDDVRRSCKGGLDLVAVMAANNEVGTIYPLEEVAAIAKDHGALVFTDATQAAGKIPVSASQWGLDLVALSAHKMYGPKGVGALAVSAGIKLHPLIHGGQHQRGLRSGTLNVPGIVGLGEACRLRASEMHSDEVRVASLRDRLESHLMSGYPELVVNGDVENRLAGNLHVSFPGLPNGALVGRLRNRLAISTGSACSSGIEGPSHVLRALGLSRERIEGALRIGIGKFTTEEDVDSAAVILTAAAREVGSVISTH